MQEEHWDTLLRAGELALKHGQNIRAMRVEGRLDARRVFAELEANFSFGGPRDGREVIDALADLLTRGSVHVTHPAYFGLFNPSVFPEAVAAATLTASFNPQLATVQHAPAAYAIEQHTLGFFATCLGWQPEDCAFHFTGGGQEANTEALAIALCQRFPEVRDRGLRVLPGDPVLYVSAEAHHSFEKAAHLLGLGRGAVRRVTVDQDLAMDASALAQEVAADRALGKLPLLVVATAGATSCGAVDPIPVLADLAADEGLWLHTDAAWGGGALLSPVHRHLLDGIERSDSVTWDAHKWLQAPMGTGMYFTRHRAAPRATFATRSPYMPARQGQYDDPYDSSLPWSRRAAGLAPFVSLATRGRTGLADVVAHMFSMGEELRAGLGALGFTLENHTALPLVCFGHPAFELGGLSPVAVAHRLQDRGRTWISTTRLSNGRVVLRAAITSYRTESRDLHVLLKELELALASPGRS